jgi:hypothetical protein
LNRLLGGVEVGVDGDGRRSVAALTALQPERDGDGHDQGEHRHTDDQQGLGQQTGVGPPLDRPRQGGSHQDGVDRPDRIRYSLTANDPLVFGVVKKAAFWEVVTQ